MVEVDKAVVVEARATVEAAEEAVTVDVARTVDDHPAAALKVPNRK